MDEIITWCREHGATIRWGKVVRLEVLAPGTTWLTLRGQGETLELAYADLLVNMRKWQAAVAKQLAAR